MAGARGAGIAFDGVWKKFRRGQLHDSLRDLIPSLVRRATTPRRPDELDGREFWALSDVSFEVKPGEALGIIGANGAGKSTTLKLLNRIMRPTRGRITVRGRVGALIEISAGFHQDLTGRENTYLQGAIMGMPRAEIARKFDDIVDFAGIADFIDTPVKRYSSGMNARLGFAIAAHLDPEVLIIDEVLAVGDFAFQNRAFGRIKEMVHSGIPVALVSHQLDRVATLCTKAILLSKGTVQRAGTPDECINEYIRGAQAPKASDDVHAVARIESVRQVSPSPTRSGDYLTYRVEGMVADGATGTFDPLYVTLVSIETGQRISVVAGLDCRVDGARAGRFAYDVTLQMNVPPGIYTLETCVVDYLARTHHSHGPALHVQVAEGRGFAGNVQLNAQMQPASV